MSDDLKRFDDRDGELLRTVRMGDRVYQLRTGRASRACDIWLQVGHLDSGQLVVAPPKITFETWYATSLRSTARAISGDDSTLRKLIEGMFAAEAAEARRGLV